MEPDHALLDRYLAGDCTPAEAASVRRWIHNHPEIRESLADLRDIREVAAGEGHWNVDAGWHSMSRQMTSLESPAPMASMPAIGAGTPSLTRRASSNPLVTPILQRLRAIGIVGGLAAATVALLVMSSWNPGTTPDPTTTPRVSTYATGDGQRSEITLPDGSHVTLSVGSRLDIPVDYDSGNRRVTLSGQAFFTVVPQSKRPFTVVTGGSETRVLGTSFLVRQYATDSVATVAVRDGKVMVNSAVLTAMQQVAVDNGNPGAVHTADSTQFTFASGTLTLSDMPLLNAIPELNRWYDADIRLGDPQLIRRRIAGGFVAGSATDLATVLEMIYNVRVVRDGRMLTLYPGVR